MTDAPIAPPRDLGAWLARRRVRKHVARPALLRPARPLISFTFDDFPKSAARTGAALLDHVGGRGTFYASAAFAGQTTHTGEMFDGGDVKRLLADGHEIGCHTYAHLDCARTAPGDVFADMVRNADALGAMGMEDRLVSFAYPYGETSVALKSQLPSRFTSARGIAPGLASGRADLAQLRANAMYGRGALQRCLAVLETARRRNGWAIFFTHDVSPRPGPWGTPTGLMERLCGAALTAGVEILPVREALARVLSESGT